MRIVILTQPLLLNNYGCLLQAYALQKILINQGHTVETDLYKAYSDQGSFFRQFLSWCKHSLRKLGSGDQFYSESFFNIFAIHNKRSFKEVRVSINCDRFVSTHLHTVDLFRGKSRPSKQMLDRYDAFVVGSDQVWRPAYSYVPAYFLKFTTGLNVKRIAYSASFGIDTWSEYTPQLTKQCAQSAQQFDAISVRESSGVSLCKDHLGVHAVHTLDPTMLLSKADYLQLIEDEDMPKRHNLMVSYILDANADKRTLVDNVSTKLQLFADTLKPASKLTDPNASIDSSTFVSVSHWLCSFRDASFVVTDSFHGAVFSIIFNVPFIVVANKSRGLARFESLLGTFGLSDRMIFSTDNLADNLLEPIDFTYANHRREELIAKSLSFLKQGLS